MCDTHEKEKINSNQAKNINISNSGKSIIKMGSSKTMNKRTNFLDFYERKAIRKISRIKSTKFVEICPKIQIKMKSLHSKNKSHFETTKSSIMFPKCNDEKLAESHIYRPTPFCIYNWFGSKGRLKSKIITEYYEKYAEEEAQVCKSHIFS